MWVHLYYQTLFCISLADMAVLYLLLSGAVLFPVNDTIFPDRVICLCSFKQHLRITALKNARQAWWESIFLCAELAPLPAEMRKLWKQSALSSGEEGSSIPFPQLRNSFCWVMRKATYIIYGQKAVLACFWMTGSRTKGKSILKFPSWPQNENLPLRWHLRHRHCVIWFCTD